MDNLSLSDISAVTRGNEGMNGNSWIVLIILFALIFNGGFGGFGNRDNAHNYATTQDVQRATDFQALERQNNEIVAAVRQAAYDTQGSIKDSSYNTLGELRDLQTSVNTGFAAMQNCCCETNRNIDSVRFDMANYAAQANANTTAQVQKVLDAISTNRMAEMQNQISALQLQNAMCGVVRYPQASTYYAGNNPFCGCNNAF